MCYNCVLRKRKNIGLSLSEKERARIRFRVQNRPVFTPEFCVLISSAVSAHQLSRDDRNVIFQTADWSVRLILCSDWLMFEKVLAGWSVSWEKALPWHWGSDGVMVTQDPNWISAIMIKVLVKNNQTEIGEMCFLHNLILSPFVLMYDFQRFLYKRRNVMFSWFVICWHSMNGWFCLYPNFNLSLMFLSNHLFSNSNRYCMNRNELSDLSY